ncbi:MAG TPA: N-6 DNA methylase, partial [Vicinamibacterales bacterium]|nr:N-6 DNA methylase [Vicinamibacterales bacterium]
FAEARGLVPLWHPVYRDRYSLEAIVTALVAERPCRGLWHAVRAISRLAHAGCAAGELRVTAFNGRLFAPMHAAAFERTRVGDGPLAATILALSTTPPTARRGRTRIAYADLDVEQLGAVYEQVLEYEPSSTRGRVSLERTRDARKASGTFYTPRALTAHLVRRTLDPLVRGRSPESILQLRVLDPAMGSGAFLVAACRYLAAAVEDARIREGTWHAGDVAAEDRRTLRREIAARCLYGVDSNPMAVQLARLSLWLVTLASDKPLSFLDHHLMAGDSLVGASLADVMRQPTKQTRRTRPAPLPLFESGELAAGLDAAARVRREMAREPDDSVAIVHAKERALAALVHRDGFVARWSAVLDLWCAGWFWDGADRPSRAVFGDLAHRLLHDRSALDASIAMPLLDRAAAIAARRRFLHWPLAFPEVFTGDAGGFDAIVGNPPWDMLRGDSGRDDVRRERRRDAELTADFVREAGIYRVESHAHVNRYQLFLERALQLLRTGGRVGFVLPSGLASDSGSAALRRHLFDHADVDAIDGLDNRAAIFPIHRSLRFVLLTATTGGTTESLSCRFGIGKLEELEATATHGEAPLVLTRRFLERVSGPDDLGIPGITSARDLRLLERISSRIAWLGHAAGWNVSFGRELNATDDRDAFTVATHRPLSRPVIEGKQVDPFRVALERSTQELRADDDRARRVPRRARVAYRDVASATNRLTLIAAVIPARAVTTHTLFCLRTPLPIDQQHVLTALLNSFVANYLVRLRVSSHVTAALVARLPVPVVPPDTSAFDRLNALARTLARASVPVEHMPEYAELQALVAHLYELTVDDFAHVLETFPLIDEATKNACLTAFASFGENDTPSH